MSPTSGSRCWNNFKIPYRPDVMINFGSNSVMTMGNAEIVTENFLKKFNFIFSFQLYVTEFEEAVADIILPDACYLERYTPAVSFPSTFSHPQGEDDWGWTIRQPVIEPMYERRDFNVVMMDICKRLGILHKYYKALNEMTFMRYGGAMSETVQACAKTAASNIPGEKSATGSSKTGSGRSTGSSMSAKRPFSRGRNARKTCTGNGSILPGCRSTSSISSMPASRSPSYASSSTRRNTSI